MKLFRTSPMFDSYERIPAPRFKAGERVLHGNGRILTVLSVLLVEPYPGVKLPPYYRVTAQAQGITIDAAEKFFEKAET